MHGNAHKLVFNTANLAQAAAGSWLCATGGTCALCARWRRAAGPWVVMSAFAFCFFEEGEGIVKEREWSANCVAKGRLRVSSAHAILAATPPWESYVYYWVLHMYLIGTCGLECSIP